MRPHQTIRGARRVIAEHRLLKATKQQNSSIQIRHKNTHTQANMPPPQFEIEPSVGLSEIKLGTNLYSILHQLSHLHLQLAYPQNKKLLTDPISVVIKKYAIRLSFDPQKQLLFLIELLDLKKVEITYKGKCIRDKGFKTIYDHYIGPTYPGEITDESYILSYPGLSFRFDLDESTSKDDTADQILETLLDRNLKAKSVAIHQSHRWSEMVVKGVKYSDCVKRLCKYDVEVEKLDIHSYGNIDIIFYKHPKLKKLSLVLNTSKQQDILHDLGTPDEVFTKNDSRTLIHSSDVSSSPTTASVFHNYFRFGFDLLYSTTRTGAVLTKVIIHSNLPTSIIFGKYAKCEWSFDPLNSNSKFSTMGIVEEGDSVPAVVLNRSEMLSNSIELLEEENAEDANEIKWGKSVVYALDREIWDVVDDCVNSLTLY